MNTGFGVSPVRICGAVASRGSRFGTTEISALVYGCSGLRTTSLAGPSSTIRPRYMTAMRSAKWAAVERSCVIITIARPVAAQVVEQAQDARPHRDVEHRHRLVGQQQLRLQHHRRGDRDPLALAAGELVREAVEVELGRLQARLHERLDHERVALRPRCADAVDLQRLGDRVADAVARVERLVRVLVDDLHLAPQRPQLLVRELRDVAAAES